jgi:uncharacterized protein (TIGR00661 family)
LEHPKRILVTPLDWGLGHATRCIPIINALLQQKHTVLIACSGASLQLLKYEFPQLKFFELPAYNPQYGIHTSMVFTMARQLPKFINAITAEHKALEALVEKHSIDVVISDNRYGCYSNKATSYIVTHQLNILMPAAWRWMEGIVNTINHHLLKNFKAVWVPAHVELEGNWFPYRLVAGKEKLNAVPIGFLSRFEKQDLPVKYDVVAICSGPEPQRTEFESMLKQQLEYTGLKTILISGKPNEKADNILENAQHTVVSHLTAKQLQNVIAQSKIVVSRSGYSTVMDMAAMQHKVIFIPTPGQTEQEYLADELKRLNIAYSVNADSFDLLKALKRAEKYKGFKNFKPHSNWLQKAIEQL